MSGLTVLLSRIFLLSRAFNATRARSGVKHLRTGLLLMCASLVMAQTANADTQADMAKLQKDIAALQNQLKAAQGTRTGLQKDLEKSEKQINDLQKKATDINKQLNEQKNELNKLEAEKVQLQKQQEAQRAQMAEQVVASYKLGQQSEMKVLFNQESPEAFARTLKYHSYFLGAHKAEIEKFTATIARIDEITPVIASRTAELSNLQKQLTAQQAELKKLHGQRQTALANVNANLKTKQDELNKLVQDRNRLQALMTQVTKSVAKAQASPAYVPLPAGGERFTARKGKLPWPTQGNMVHKFGSPRIAGQLNWTGAYIAAPEGNSVVAVHHGRVVFSDYFGGHGLIIIVDHGEGYMSLYAHNQVLFKKAGELVKAGENIARVGNSGGQSTTGVYFEIRQRGNPINPSPWLAGS